MSTSPQTTSPPPSAANPLVEDLYARIENIDTEGQLAAFMGSALKSMLRRGGDQPFMSAIQDAYVARVSGCAIDKQRAIARDVLRTVVDMRPEIAAAWVHFQKHQAGGTQTPSIPDAPAGPWHGQERRHIEEKTPQQEADEQQALSALDAEGLTMHCIAGHVTRRLAIFHLARPAIPSSAYYHDLPFFLFDRTFHHVLADFIAKVLTPLCRPVLTRLVYRDLSTKSDQPLEARQAFVSSRQAEIDKALGQRLSALAQLCRSAQEIIAKSEEEGDEGPSWKTVTVPQIRPRSVSVLGLKVPLGTVNSTRTIRVRTDGGRDFSADEIEALTLFTQLQNMAANEGLDMPDACDFQFICLLLEFDLSKFSASIKELAALATHSLTSEEFLLSRVKRAEIMWQGGLSDVLLLMLFYDSSDRGFGIPNLQRFCIGTSLDPIALAKYRPFLFWELNRRPRELALQIREVLQTRLPVNTLEAVIRKLFLVWKNQSRVVFERAFEVALGVIATFPIVFTGHPDEADFTAIADRLRLTLSDDSPDYESALLAITTLYSKTLKGKRL